MPLPRGPTAAQTAAMARPPRPPGPPPVHLGGSLYRVGAGGGGCCGGADELPDEDNEAEVDTEAQRSQANSACTMPDLEQKLAVWEAAREIVHSSGMPRIQADGSFLGRGGKTLNKFEVGWLIGWLVAWSYPPFPCLHFSCPGDRVEKEARQNEAWVRAPRRR